MKNLLWPLGFIYGKAMQVRNLLFDKGMLSPKKFDVPVISVGNLTMGGTGKTPIIAELVQWSLNQGFKPAIVSRGYRSRETYPRRVMPQSADSGAFGDEPTMLAEKFPDVPIYVGAKRVDVVAKLLSEQKVDLIFADDAFQHRMLGRVLDILVIDATEKIQNYQVLPVGRAREGLNAIERAHFIIVNKCNLVSPEEKNELITFLESVTKDKDIPIIECEYSITALKKITDNTTVELPMGRPTCFLVSGIGNPKSLEALLTKSFDVRGHLSFRDHHNYDKNDLKKIRELSNFKNVKYVITTEKDAVKLRHFSEDISFYATILTLKPSIRMKFIYERIVQLCH